MIIRYINCLLVGALRQKQVWVQQCNDHLASDMASYDIYAKSMVTESRLDVC
jgi:hypothetical protein